jgi:hypothetical protein
MQIKIDNDIVSIHNINTQLTIGSHANIDIEIDTNKYPDYYNYFIEKYEKRIVFNIMTNTYIGEGCVIKKIDIIFESKLNLSIICSRINTDISNRRDEVLIDILENKDNI